MLSPSKVVKTSVSARNASKRLTDRKPAPPQASRHSWIVLEAFLDKLQTMADGPEKDALNHLCDLFALTCIESDRAWFLEHGRLSNARAKAVTRRVNQVCRRVRPLAGDLVDALGVPREMLRAELLEFSGS